MNGARAIQPLAVAREVLAHPRERFFSLAALKVTASYPGLRRDEFFASRTKAFR
jgi:hypothetical protein